MSLPDRSEEIFQQVLDAPQAEREPLLERLCAGDAALLEEVRSLLGCVSTGPDFLETPVFGSGEPDGAVSPELKRLGTYEIVELLGEGGMGCVYRARQEQPEREVALKVIRPGFVTPRSMRRFEHESQVLARLRHPGIAQVFEAGSAPGPDGRSVPYFAMELVRGRPITQVAAALGREDRLLLLARVCDAVQHAHERGVIHRDLKPANVLVEEAGPEGSGTSTGSSAAWPMPAPRILDFGVARLTTGSPQHSVLTQRGEIVGTLTAMAPEQLAADSERVDTRSDVYALGALGYEMLAGRPPLELSGASLPQAIKIIEEQEPLQLGEIDRALSGDVETVIAKAMSKEPRHRYLSAGEFAADLRRILADEPVVARTPTLAEQLRRFARRRRPLAIAAGLSLVSLVAGLAISLTMYARAKADQARADRETQLSEAVRQYLVMDLLTAASPDREGYDVRVMDVLLKAGSTLSQRFGDRPEIEAAIRQNLGEALVPLGRGAESLVHLRKALAVHEAGLPESAPRVVATLCAISAASSLVSDLPAAQEAGRRAMTIAATYVPDDRLLACRAAVSLAEPLQAGGKPREALDLLEPLISEALRDLSLQDNTCEAMLATMGAAAKALDQLDRVAELGQMGLELSIRRVGPDHPSTLLATNNLINALVNVKKFDAAADLAVGFAARVDKAFAPDHLFRVGSRLTCGDALRKVRRYDAAEPLLLDAYAAAERTAGPTHPMTAEAIAQLRQLYAAAPNRGREMALWSARALRLRLEIGGPDDREALKAMLQKMVSDCALVNVEVEPLDLLLFTFDPRLEKTGVEPAREARAAANWARLAAPLNGSLASESLTRARGAMTTSAQPSVDQQLIDLAAAEIGK